MVAAVEEDEAEQYIKIAINDSNMDIVDVVAAVEEDEAEP